MLVCYLWVVDLYIVVFVIITLLVGWVGVLFLGIVGYLVGIVWVVDFDLVLVVCEGLGLVVFVVFVFGGFCVFVEFFMYLLGLRLGGWFGLVGWDLGGFGGCLGIFCAGWGGII